MKDNCITNINLTAKANNDIYKTFLKGKEK